MKECELYLDHQPVWAGDGFFCQNCMLRFVPSNDTAVPPGSVPARSPDKCNHEDRPMTPGEAEIAKDLGEYIARSPWIEEFHQMHIAGEMMAKPSEVEALIQQVHDSAYKQGCKDVIEDVVNKADIDLDYGKLCELQHSLADKFLSSN